MKRSNWVLLLILGVVVLVGALWLARSDDVSGAYDALTSEQEQAAEMQTASGRVAAVSATSLSIESDEIGLGEIKRMDFVLDSDTKIEGQLQAGSSVEVHYRAKDGRNIATHVRIV